MSIYVAYNGYGDLIATGHSYARLLLNIKAAGYDPDEVLIGRAHA